jgi:hypothetical protein
MFQDPVPYGLWPTDLDGTNFGQHCPQFDRITGQTIGNEDCLFLNIFTPFISVSGKLRQFSFIVKFMFENRNFSKIAPFSTLPISQYPGFLLENQ